MWVFTEIADWFDRQRIANNKFLDDTFQDWVSYAEQHGDDPGFASALRNVAIYAGTGSLYAVNQLSTTVASGFVDILRIGDGVKKGGWGYAQDAVRLLSIAPVLRYARLALVNVAMVDVEADICAWVAARNALLLTGQKHFVSLFKVLETAGVDLEQLDKYAGALMEEIQAVFAILNVESTVVSTGDAVEQTVLGALGDGQSRLAVFGVRWWTVIEGEVTRVGHVLIGRRNAISGVLEIIDRDGNVYGSLADLEFRYPPGISKAVFADLETAIILVENSVLVKVLESGAPWGLALQTAQATVTRDDGVPTLETDATWVLHAIGHEVRSVPFRVETHASVEMPVRPVLRLDQLQTQTLCMPIVGNSDNPDASPPSCEVLTMYRVQSGDTRSGIAQAVYGDGGRWGGIAAANGIADPTTLRAGAVIVIP
ncbi:MAG: LysM peptidoglycan-binding domain-containing protein [Polyangiaceae bacterium]